MSWVDVRVRLIGFGHNGDLPKLEGYLTNRSVTPAVTPGKNLVARPEGFEPPTRRFEV